MSWSSQPYQKITNIYLLCSFPLSNSISYLLPTDLWPTSQFVVVLYFTLLLITYCIVLLGIIYCEHTHTHTHTHSLSLSQTHTQSVCQIFTDVLSATRQHTHSPMCLPHQAVKWRLTCGNMQSHLKCSYQSSSDAPAYTNDSCHRIRDNVKYEAVLLRDTFLQCYRTFTNITNTLRHLTHWKFLFGNFLLKDSYKKISSVNSLLSKFHNIEHVLFCEIKFHEILHHKILLDFQNKNSSGKGAQGLKFHGKCRDLKSFEEVW